MAISNAVALKLAQSRIAYFIGFLRGRDSRSWTLRRRLSHHFAAIHPHCFRWFIVLNTARSLIFAPRLTLGARRTRTAQVARVAEHGDVRGTFGVEARAHRAVARAIHRFQDPPR